MKPSPAPAVPSRRGLAPSFIRRKIIGGIHPIPIHGHYGPYHWQLLPALRSMAYALCWWLSRKVRYSFRRLLGNDGLSGCHAGLDGATMQVRHGRVGFATYEYGKF